MKATSTSDSSISAQATSISKRALLIRFITVINLRKLLWLFFGFGAMAIDEKAAVEASALKISKTQEE
jgi:hypothetical protein